MHASHLHALATSARASCMPQNDTSMGIWVAELAELPCADPASQQMPLEAQDTRQRQAAEQHRCAYASMCMEAQATCCCHKEYSNAVWRDLVLTAAQQHEAG